MKRLSTTDFVALDELLEQEVNTDRGVDGLETVRRVYPKLQQLREQGVPFKQLVELLNRQGLELSSSTLHRYLKRVAKERRRVDRASTQPTTASTARPPQLVTTPAPTATAPRPAPTLSLASKAAPPADGTENAVERAPVNAGHFVPAPDSDRI